MGDLLLILVVAATEQAPLTIAKPLSWLVLIRSVPWVILVGEAWMFFSKGALWNQMRIDWWSQSSCIQLKHQPHSGYLTVMKASSSLHANKASWFKWPITKSVCALSYFCSVGLERERERWAGQQKVNKRERWHPAHSKGIFFGRLWPRDAAKHSPFQNISNGSRRTTAHTCEADV